MYTEKRGRGTILVAIESMPLVGHSHMCPNVFSRRCERALTTSLSCGGTTVSGGALRVQRKIWAAADFQNFLARPNTRRPRKKAFFSWSTRIWPSEKILKIGRGPNFSLHAQGSPADHGGTYARLLAMQCMQSVLTLALSR